MPLNAPEPWRDLPPARCRERDRVEPDLNAKQGGTELGWGAGLVAPMYNYQPPGAGNSNIGKHRRRQYMPKCPRVDPPCSGVCVPREHHTPGEVHGYPGDTVRP
jgi:hypothetical protein